MRPFSFLSRFFFFFLSFFFCSETALPVLLVGLQQKTLWKHEFWSRPEAELALFYYFTILFLFEMFSKICWFEAVLSSLRCCIIRSLLL